MFTVFDSEKRAIGSNFGIRGECWNNASFSTFAEAVNYARNWLGEYPIPHNILPENWDGSEIDYSGYGDTISIREE